MSSIVHNEAICAESEAASEIHFRTVPAAIALIHPKVEVVLSDQSKHSQDHKGSERHLDRCLRIAQPNRSH